MLQQDAPGDYVIATGECRPLADFVARVFACVGLDWRDHVESNQALLRPTDLQKGWGNPAKALRELGWEARHHMEDVARMMVEARAPVLR